MWWFMGGSLDDRVMSTTTIAAGRESNPRYRRYRSGSMRRGMGANRTHARQTADRNGRRKGNGQRAEYRYL